MLDCIIVGSGPAGISAALNLSIYHKEFLLFGSKDLSLKMSKADEVVNYPGFPHITGKELKDRFKEHLSSFNIEITEKTVTNISKTGEGYYVLADNELYETRSIILSTGVAIGKPLENEERLLGRGVSYCATCDGNFFKGKKIAVYANDSKFEHEVEFLADLASEVYYYVDFDSKIQKENIHFSKALPVTVNGENRVESISLHNGKTVTVDGIFCLRNALAPTQLLPLLEVQNGHIVVDGQMKTNLKGIFASGDCVGRPYQFAKAVGEGNIAAHSVIAYLNQK